MATDYTTERFDFGVTDRLGRTIGYVVFRSVGPDGEFFRLRAQVTRNGNPHQATTGYRFTTEAERDAKVAEIVAGARKRALSPAARLKS